MIIIYKRTPVTLEAREENEAESHPGTTIVISIPTNITIVTIIITTTIIIIIITIVIITLARPWLQTDRAQPSLRLGFTTSCHLGPEPEHILHTSNRGL